MNNKRNLQKNVFSHTHIHSKKKKRHIGKAILTIIITIFGIGLVRGFLWFHKNVIKDLPDVNSIKDMIFSQASVITDRNGEELYKVFSENREYIEYNDISDTMINALVAIEDQRYREHSGLDPVGIIRAAIKNVIKPGEGGGASTLPQQLLKNLLLNKDLHKETMKQKIVRKFKEFLLTSKLEDSLEENIRQEKGRITKEELHMEMKKETLELYLNYISFGNNAYGIESAAKTYFGIEAKDLNIIQSAILASLPKGPTLFNPYRNKSLLMGELVVTDQQQNKVILGSGDLKNTIIDKITTNVNNANFDNKDTNAITKFFKGLGSFDVIHANKKYQVEYKYGRKDIVLARMFEDRYISQDELKSAFLSGIDFEFKQHTFPIKAPHFVHWVIELLEERYDREALMNGGLVIKTTLNYEIQEIAEEIIKENQDVLDMYGANNNAMLYTDTENGDVLAYIGSIDYFDETIEGKNDMVRRPRQPGSTMKPFIYALGFQNLPITLDTPIFDIPFEIGGKDRPGNADGKFMGMLPLKKALAYSRNIPAAKMILAAGGEEIAKPFLKSLGLNSLSDNVEYGYPLAFGAGEIKMLELANAYSHLSTSQPAEIDPILEVRSTDGSILYQKTGTQQKEIIKPGIRYLIWEIISSASNMPPSRAAEYLISGLRYGLKSGTSNMETENGSRARDGWLVSYTPSKVLAFWAGNTNGEPMYRNAYGGFLSSSAMKNFWTELLDNNFVSNESIPKVETTQVNISKLSGRLPTETTPVEFQTQTLGYVYNLPEDGEPEIVPIEIDLLCKGKASPYTPADEIKAGYVITPTSFMPENMDLEEIKRWRKNSTTLTGMTEDENGLVWGTIDYLEDPTEVRYNYDNIFIQYPEKVCEERIPKDDPSINIDIIKPIDEVMPHFGLWYSVQGPRNIAKTIIAINDIELTSFDYQGTRSAMTDARHINLPEDTKEGKYNITITIIDVEGYSNAKEFEIEVIGSDNKAPKLMTNKINIKQSGETYTVTLVFEDDNSFVQGGEIKDENGNELIVFEGSLATFTTTTLGEISITAKDYYENILNTTIDLADYR